MTDSSGPASRGSDTVSRTNPGLLLHADALRLLSTWPAPDAAQERLRDRYVAHLRVRPDGLTRGCFPDHLTASALILSADASQVLLTLHAKANAWFQMGGHCEPADTTLAGAALREALEESGMTGLTLDPVPVQLDAHEVTFCDSRGTVTHLDVRFLAVAELGTAHAVSAESLDVRWWPVDALPTDDPGMHRLVEHALARHGDSSGRAALQLDA